MLKKIHHSHIRFYVFSIIIGSLLCSGGYVFARSYLGSRVAALHDQEQLALSTIKQHDSAYQLLREAESSISALQEHNIPASSAAELFAQLRNSFSAGKYGEIDPLYAQVASEAARLESEDTELQASYSASLVALEKKIEDYKKQGVKTATVSAEVASVSAVLSEKRYSELPAWIGGLSRALDVMLANKKEEDRKAALARASVASPIAPQSNGGVTYERKVVNTSLGGFTSDILTVDMNRVKVKTFAANSSDCASECPVKPLANYVSENGGIAGINGTYFCPPDYSQCGGVKNSFNTLVFDYASKNYLNSAQNQYSVNPLISFYNDGAHFYSQALGFGRDPSANGVISNHPTLMHNGGIATNPNLDAKSSSKGLRCGLGFRDKTLWAVCVRGVTVAESAYVYQSLGATYAMNLDGGGSAALYFNGYKVGPGRLLPNAVVFTN